MAFDGNGNWVSNYSAVAQRDADLPILASNFDNILLADLATSFENCLTKDGQVKVQQAFDANSYKVINVATPTNNNDATNKQYVDSALNNKVSTLLGTLYPVGSVYIGTQTSCPLASLISGSTWVRVGAGYSLWTGNGQSNGTTQGTTSYTNYNNGKANTTIETALPNIKGTFEPLSRNNDTPTTGAFYKSASGNSQNDYTNYGAVFGFDASRSSSVYKNNATIAQPPAYVVNVWRRTA